jgi:hypothetical protein
MKVLQIVFGTGLLAATACTEPILRAAKAPKVDLGYAMYEGTYDANNSVNVFKGYGPVG